MPPNTDKKILRKTLKNLRANLSDKDQKSLQIQKFLIEICKDKRCSKIFTYLSFESEVSTYDFIENCFKNNLTVSVPFCRENEMLSIRINSLSDLKTSTIGIQEPDSDKINLSNHTIDPCKLDLIVIPGLGFDTNGNRLGYGKGYYDKFLSLNSNTFKIGLCFDEQIIENLPTEPHDQKIDLLISDKKILNFREEKK